MSTSSTVKKWSRIQFRMALSYVGVTVLTVLLLELLVLLAAFVVVQYTPLLNELAPSALQPALPHVREEILVSLWKGWLRSGPGLILLMTPIGLLFGIFTTRGLVRRLQRLVQATRAIAGGDYAYRLSVERSDEIGQLEAQCNQMAERLAESIARQGRLSEENARLQERARIARDLHDSVKQQIFALSMQIGASLSHLENGPMNVVRRHLEDADTLAYQARQELTTLIEELRPLGLQGRDLATALREMVATWSRHSDVMTEVLVQGSCQLAAPLEEALFRVAQEALANSGRHSKADLVTVTLLCEQRQLLIQDNGQGFESGSVQHNGIGLHSMRERMEAVIGSLTVDSSPGSGTCIIAQWSSDTLLEEQAEERQ